MKNPHYIRAEVRRTSKLYGGWLTIYAVAVAASGFIAWFVFGN